MLRNLKEEKCQRPAANQRHEQLELEMRWTNNGIYLYPRPTSAPVGHLLLLLTDRLRFLVSALAIQVNPGSTAWTLLGM